MRDQSRPASENSTRVLSLIEEELPRGSGLLVAVSGGMDSMTLLDACTRLRPVLDLRIEIAHVDHGVRSESGSDAAFVAERATEYGYPVHLRSLEGPGTGENMEAWGRRERYSFFADLLRERQLDWTVTAHTASDLVETLLMKLLANKELRPIARRDEVRRCLRPMLQIERREVEAYVAANALRYVIDQSNFDLARTRNKVRHLLLPFIGEHFGSGALEALSRRGLALARDGQTLDELCDPSIARLSEITFGSREWLLAYRRESGSFPEEIRWRLAERVLHPVLKFRIGRLHGARAAAFFDGDAPGLELPGGVALRRKNRGITVLRTR